MNPEQVAAAVPRVRGGAPVRVMADACVPCVLHDIVGALDVLGADQAQRERVMLRLLEMLRTAVAEKPLPSVTITASHRIVKEELGLDLPFAALRRRCNEVGAELAARVRDEVAGIRDPEKKFKRLVLWAIAGNEVDFRTVGTGYAFSMEALHDRLAGRVERGLDIDECDAAWAAVKEGRDLLYIPDNVGEIALDRLLIEFLRDTLGTHITLTYRGGPITSDAIRQDFVDVGLDTLVDRFVLAGPDTLGISLEEMTDELRAAIATTPVILAKGQANFYVACGLVPRLDPNQTWLSLLTTKCGVITSRMSKPGNSINAIRVFPGGARP